MQKTIYVRDEDERLFDQAENVGAGRSLSAVIAEALRRWLAIRGDADRLGVIAEQAIEYLDGAQEASSEDIAAVLEISTADVDKALKRANRRVRKHIAEAVRGNMWYEETYPVETRDGWELAFTSYLDKDEDED